MNLPEGDSWLARQIGEDRLQIAYLFNENQSLREIVNEKEEELKKLRKEETVDNND